MISMMACTTTAPCLSIYNQFDCLHDYGDSDLFMDKDEDFVMEKVDIEPLAIKPVSLLSLRAVHVESELSPTDSIPESTLTVMKPSIEPLLMPNVCTMKVNEVNATDKVSKAEKSIYTYILAMKLDKQEQLHKFCRTVYAKCTT